MNIPGLLNYLHWRKSSQWFVLTRQHASIVNNDTAVDGAFRQFCVSADDIDVCCRYGDCLQ